MKNSIKRITSGLLIVLILAAMPITTVSASTVTDKEEIVYGNLGYDGKPGALYVINAFDAPTAGALNDRGDYSAVVNLSTADELSLSGNHITGSLPAGKFYYQGYLRGTEIPWDISVRYTLDGNAISGSELAGRSGHLVIEASITQKDVQSVYKDFYAIQSSITLKGDKARNVQSENATVASVGNDKQLSYIALPGENQHIVITADVTDFEMDGMSFNMTPFSLDIEDPDTADIKARLRELQNGAIDLDNGAREFFEGITQMEDGVRALVAGVGELQTGANEIAAGAQELAAGGTALSSGAAELQTGAATFATGVAALDGQSAGLMEGSAAIKAGLDEMAGAVAGMDAEQMAAAKEQALALQAGSQAYLDSLDGLIATYQAQFDATADDDPAKPVLGETLATFQGLRASYADINTGVATMSGSVVAQADSLPALASGVQGLATQYGELYTGITTYTAGVGELNSGFAAMVTGIEALVAGVGELGVGASELQTGVQAFVTGAGELSSGMAELQGGMRELREGAVELTDGTSELRVETADMDSEIDEEIDKLLETYRTKDFEAVSFADGGTSRVKSVQFTFMTPEISVQEVVQVVEDEPEPDLWQRFIALFWKED